MKGFWKIAGLTAAVMLLDQWLRRTNALKGNGEGYAKRPKPQPTYDPLVVMTLQKARASGPLMPSGELQTFYRSLRELEAQQQRIPEAQARVTQAVKEKQRQLAEHRARIEQAQTDLERRLQKKSLQDIERAADRGIEFARESYEKSIFKAQLDKKYQDALEAAKRAYRDRINLYVRHGSQSDAAMSKVREALLNAGETEILTSEGSIPL